MRGRVCAWSLAALLAVDATDTLADDIVSLATGRLVGMS